MNEENKNEELERGFEDDYKCESNGENPLLDNLFLIPLFAILLFKVIKREDVIEEITKHEVHNDNGTMCGSGKERPPGDT